ncbi:tRNA uridine-5-carboxymethylaminomethyl(34) synthesis GTPase MnmE [Candidatus Ishikawella capsulata]|uniref:tRNA modification GTPase MnmE n=1 Tax=Candidatus Ishikawaella capsulata Mpkobe TaxID=476281 RepID=C5WC27_9ENTR|nr:tRNA uridine-5-carboxymethylaminomethyl(34) synthesis GTPase MnmE [Candidatus Ishikawaella capsulata]BAH82883.1 tRNA modification GTPase [Candidatus Ishikawaella capsulata Mpkobe]
MSGNNDTIVAQATPIGRASIGVIRVSGIYSKLVANKILGHLPRANYAKYLPFKDIKGKIIDYGIAIWFPHPHSFTGEDILELQGHSNPVIIDLLIENILKLPGIRIARPGEFSERAFLNHKIDLLQAESIADLIEASSKQAAQSAIKSLQGFFSTAVNRLITQLNNLRVNIEADINFPDEDNSYCYLKNTNIKLSEIINELDNVLNEAHKGSMLREGINIVIAGLPNAGKSSLLNTLVRHEAAIVTNIIGTTRDILKECIQIDGLSCNIIDTAGLRTTNNLVESIGIKRAWQEIKHADHILFTVDSSVTNMINMSAETKLIWQKIISNTVNKNSITIIRNKIDITGEKASYNIINGYPSISLSTYTGFGMEILYKHLKQYMGFTNNVESKFIARRRHIQALKLAKEHLQIAQLNTSRERAILAEELRLAQEALNEITGKFTSNDLLNSIFSKFCLGK